MAAESYLSVDSIKVLPHPEVEAKLRDAQADLEDAFRAMSSATNALATACAEYEIEHGPVPRRYLSEDPKVAKIIAAHKAHDVASGLRDSAKSRIAEAMRQL